MLNVRLFFRFLFLFGLSIPGVAQSEERVLSLVGEPSGKISIEPYLSTLVLPFREDDRQVPALDDPRFVPWQGKSLDTFSMTRVWSRMALRNESDRDLLLYFFSLESFRSGSYHLCTLSGCKTLQEGSYLNPKSPYTVRHHRPAVPVLIPRGESWILVESVASIQIKPSLHGLYSFQAMQETKVDSDLFYGTLLGCMLSIFLYNLAMAIRLRDAGIGFYCAYVFCHTLAYLGMTGLLRTYLPWSLIREHPYPTNVGFFSLSLMFSLSFTLRFLRLKEVDRLSYIFCRSLLIFIPVLTATVLIYGNIRFVVIAFSLESALALFGLAFMGLRSSLRGYRPAYFFLAAWIWLILGSLMQLAYENNLLSQSEFVRQGTFLGSCLEMILMSIALADRVSFERQASAELIEKLNSDLIEKNELLTAKNIELERSNEHRLHLNQELSHAMHAREHLVSELAHRGNNPLHATQLSLSLVRQQTEDFSAHMKSLFSTVEGKTEEEQYWEDFILSYIQEVRKIVSEVQPNLERMRQTISDIRLLSGVDGYIIEEIIMERVLDGALSRLEENSGSMERRRVRIHCENPRSIRLNSHDRVVSIVLERILRQWLLEMPRQSVLELNCFSEQGGKVVILAASTPLHVFVSSRTHELVAQINHILLPYELMFQFQEREHGSVLILRPPQLDLAGSRVFTSHRAS